MISSFLGGGACLFPSLSMSPGKIGEEVVGETSVCRKTHAKDRTGTLVIPIVTSQVEIKHLELFSSTEMELEKLHLLNYFAVYTKMAWKRPVKANKNGNQNHLICGMAYQLLPPTPSPSPHFFQFIVWEEKGQWRQISKLFESPTSGDCFNWSHCWAGSGGNLLSLDGFFLLSMNP